MTPIPLTQQHGRPRYPLLAIDPADDVKIQLAALGSSGVTCDAILDIMDELRADPAALGRWFAVVDR